MGGAIRAIIDRVEDTTMPDYQVDFRDARELRIGEGDDVVASFRRGRFIQDMKGEIRGQPSTMRLPAPWRGMRYRLVQDDRELASAATPDFERIPDSRGQVAIFALEMPGRKLELRGEGRHGLLYRLSEGGTEIGRFEQRDFDEQDTWSADFRTREESPGLAAFVAWLTREVRQKLVEN